MTEQDILEMVISYNENLLDGEVEMTFDEMKGILGIDRGEGR